MTSSLVGSEMCIRDRNRFYHGLQTPDTLKCPVHELIVVDTARAHTVKSCLLYTSDAADDM
eukprot:5106395-Prorocentrum_lima.AAC.1